MRILESLVEQSTLFAALVTPTPNWEAFDSDQLEIIWATTDYNTMSQAPKEIVPPHTSLICSRWDPFTILEGPGLYPPIVPQQQLGGSPSSQVNGAYYDTMAFSGVSPFTSFFDGGGTSFGG